ncbi:hypothetical protein CDAR_577581, partial [Caerostris darwini]
MYHPHQTHCSPLKRTQIQQQPNQSPALQIFPEKRIKKINTKILFFTHPHPHLLKASTSGPPPSQIPPPFSTTNPFPSPAK